MRDDMFKVIVERPRWASRFGDSVKLKQDPDFDRTHVGLKRHSRERARIGKSLNENLAPLARFLRRQVGRRWDDVFSEICAKLDTGSTVKMHVRLHLDDLVISRIAYGRNGELVHNGRVLDPGRIHRWSRGIELFVDPDDGILKDRVRFWRDRGLEAPVRARDLEWRRK
jgi:hypothetical protein